MDRAGAPPTTEVGSLFTKPLITDVNVGSDCPEEIVKLLALTVSVAGRMVNVWVSEAAL